MTVQIECTDSSVKKCAMHTGSTDKGNANFP